MKQDNRFSRVSLLFPFLPSVYHISPFHKSLAILGLSLRRNLSAGTSSHSHNADIKHSSSLANHVLETQPLLNKILDYGQSHAETQDHPREERRISRHEIIICYHKLKLSPVFIKYHHSIFHKLSFRTRGWVSSFWATT